MGKAKFKSLFAIYKNGIHKGNIRAVSSETAIRNYILDSGYPIENLSDGVLIAQYCVTVAEKEIHY